MIKKERKRIIIASTTLIGTIIGAGILGIPYVVAKSGFFIGLFWLILLGGIVFLVHAYLGEITLRTKGTHQLTGYAQKYLGNVGRKIMIFTMIFQIYIANIAYLVGEGESLSFLFFDNVKYALIFGIFFWLVMALILREGLKGLKRLEYWGVIIIGLVILGILSYYFPSINYSNINYIHSNNLFLPLT